nr:hypothetical protein [Lachnospiraceae bacterium]
QPVLQEAKDRLSDQLQAAKEYVDSIGQYSIAARRSIVVTKYTREFRIINGKELSTKQKCWCRNKMYILRVERSAFVLQE